MKHRSTRQAVEDLRASGRLVVCEGEVDPNLEMAEIQRRVYLNGGPAVYFPQVKGTRFPCVSNLFANLEQARFLFRDTLESVRRLIELKIDPQAFPRNPLRYRSVPFTALRMLPRRCSNGSVMQSRTSVSELPKIKCWPDDGGAFVTLPQVLSADPSAPKNLMQVNLGMYRVQLDGNDYETDREVGLHYQIHRGVGVHHVKALQQGEPLNVVITVGGSPAMTVAAVMPLPEGLTELTFAGALAGRRIRMIQDATHAPIYADADFAIVGKIFPGQSKPEGPFGDHLGYYSLTHDFPVLKIDAVYHRKDAVWPFTVVGRPPQEDTTFGQLIHELTGPIIPTVIPGVKAVHAVDAAGVHPLLLAIGSERYMPFAKETRPAELLTQANAILGNGQLSLAKYLFIINGADDPELDIHHIDRFLEHLLRRVDWGRDLHFQTRTTIDTLDYSGDGLNRGSKAIIAACGSPVRDLPTELPNDLRLPSGFSDPRIVLPGILTVSGSARQPTEDLRSNLERFCSAYSPSDSINQFPLITLVDDSRFAANNLQNWLWTTFTRSNPAVDIDGIAGETVHRHWGCRGSLVIDARRKPHHAPPVIEDPETVAKVDARAARGGELAKYL